ncbi:26S proteasome regulatory subunit 10B homolog A-like [Rutidosis leptorrhynchoides]|uniref:26S proteasome regulatory subunit 10B homolog A-like n=1 Tax=Rutidosis leptorrhynchoides TaxID=125765 RepID=UPI003A9A3603
MSIDLDSLSLVDLVVYNMLHEDPGNVNYSAVGGLSDQIRELRESIELPLMNSGLFLWVGIKPLKAVLLYGPPGTRKTLLARAIASNIDANFFKVVSSAIIDKVIGESARLIREMFNYARDLQLCSMYIRTLYDQLNRCVTAYGKRLLKAWFARPLYDINSIIEHQEAVAGVKVISKLIIEASGRNSSKVVLYEVAAKKQLQGKKKVVDFELEDESEDENEDADFEEEHSDSE